MFLSLYVTAVVCLCVCVSAAVSISVRRCDCVERLVLKLDYLRGLLNDPASFDLIYQFSFHFSKVCPRCVSFSIFFGTSHELYRSTSISVEPCRQQTLQVRYSEGPGSVGPEAPGPKGLSPECLGPEYPILKGPGPEKSCSCRRFNYLT